MQLDRARFRADIAGVAQQRVFEMDPHGQGDRGSFPERQVRRVQDRRVVFVGHDFRRRRNTRRFVFEDRFTRTPLEFLDDTVAFDFLTINKIQKPTRDVQFDL